jgi:NADH-ubiquinone oxidoreductase chain 2
LIPPLIGFFSKQFVLLSSIENGTIFLSIVAILVSVISASYYLKLIKLTFFNNESSIASLGNSISETLVTTENSDFIENRDEYSINESKGISPFIMVLSNTHSYIISILTLMILFFFLNPSIILNGTQLASLVFFNI